MSKIVICKRCKRKKVSEARGLCKSCYTTWRRKGKPKMSEYCKIPLGYGRDRFVSLEKRKDRTILNKRKQDLIKLFHSRSIEEKIKKDKEIIIAEL